MAFFGKISFILAGLVGGILGGAGMGGGTLLIPLLTLLLFVPSQSAQAINLLAFIPMSVFALILHKKNGFLKLNNLSFLFIFAMIFAVLGAILANSVSKELAKMLFGVFLIVLSVLGIFLSICLKKKN